MKYHLADQGCPTIVKTIQAIVINLECLPELFDQTLFMNTSCTFNARYRDSNLNWSGSFFPDLECWRENVM